jgi:SulP family sulfate permease
VSPAPFLAVLRGYTAGLARRDLLAGLTVAVFAVPQALAYAMLAGVPPVYGLYTAVVMSVVGALWGSSPFLNTGPTNSAALLTAAAMAAYAGRADLAALVAALTLLVGILRLAMALLRTGKLVSLIPESAILGFTVGAGLLIATGQAHHLLGLPAVAGEGFLARMGDVAARAGVAHGPTVAVGVGTLAVMLIFDRWSKRFPVALAAMALAAVVPLVLGPGSGIRLVGEVAPIGSGLPAFRLPCLDPTLYREVFPAAVAIAVIGLMEAVSIGQALALKHGQRVNFDQEFMGQGLSHIAAAFLQGIPGSGSFSRSAMIEQAGGATCMSNVFFGVFTALALVTIPGAMERIPVSALAGLLLFVGIRLIDFRRVIRVFQVSRTDAAVMVTTFAVTVFVKVSYGIFAGIVLAALLFLNRARRFRLVETVPLAGGGVEELPGDPADGAPSDVVALNVASDLFYGVAHDLARMLGAVLERRRPKHLILRVRQAHHIDYSCWSVIYDVAAGLQAQEGQLYLCGVRPGFERVLGQADIRRIVPPDHIYPAQTSLLTSFGACASEVVKALPEDARLTPEWAALRDAVRANHSAI